MLSFEGMAGDCSYCCSNFQLRECVLGSDIFFLISVLVSDIYNICMYVISN